MRKTCLECVAKHLGSAAVYIEEVAMGYPLYFGYVYGQLDHAASECLHEYPELAMTIREHRIKWANSRNGEWHVIPFEALFDYINVLEELEGTGDNVEIPPEAYAGLDLNEEGKPVFSMDTRPMGMKDDKKKSESAKDDKKKSESAKDDFVPCLAP